MQILKEYAKPFVVEETKLTAIVAKLEQQFRAGGCEDVQPRFDLTFSNGVRELLDSSEKVLATDNSSKRRVPRLLPMWEASDKRVQVDFMGYSSDPNRARAKVIAVRVDSSDAGWRDRTLAAIEEQVERTFQPMVLPLAALLSIGVLMLILFISVLDLSAIRLSDQMWLKTADVEEVSKILNSSPVVTEEQSRQILTRQLRNFVEAAKPNPAVQKGHTARGLLLLIPVSLVAVCILILLSLYPKAVFLWGDEKERQASRLHWRRYTWGAIFTVLALGIGSRFLGSYIERLFP